MQGRPKVQAFPVMNSGNYAVPQIGELFDAMLDGQLDLAGANVRRRLGMIDFRVFRQ